MRTGTLNQIWMNVKDVTDVQMDIWMYKPMDIQTYEHSDIWMYEHTDI